MKEIKNKIREMFPFLNEDELELHCERVLSLADHLCLEHDSIVDLMDKDYFTLNGGLGRHAGLQDYRLDDDWWWYMDENANSAVNVRTGVFIEGDLIELDFE